MGKQAPKMPDYQGAAQQQAEASQQAINTQTQANRPNQQNAFGSTVQWTQGPDGQWTQTQGFGGPLGQASSALQSQAAGNLSNPFSFGQFGQLGDGDAARTQAIDSAFTQARSRLDPLMDQRQTALDQKLANQGIDPNSQAALNAQGNFGRDRNDAYTSALASAIAQGTEAGNSVFRNNLAARQQSIGEALQQRQLPLQEMAQLFSFTQQPDFMGAGAADPTQFLPAAMAQGNYGLQATQMQNQMWADYMKGIGELLQGGAAVGGAISDARLKHRVERLGVRVQPGVELVAFEYLPGLGLPEGRHVGVLAQELEEVAPQYVTTRPDGMKMVDQRFVRKVG